MIVKLTTSELEYWQKQWLKDEATDTAFNLILEEDGDLETAFNELFQEKNGTIPSFNNQSLWEVILQVMRQEICGENDSLKSQIQAVRNNPGKTSILTGIIIYIIEKCPLPLDTALATMILLYLLKVGIDIFCDYTAN
ncbi:hypothetical protein [Crocosphaera sp. XPORK-15E]|uniref:hypothetical protein n=1 Tax=Crocosphaera sp. XPORK-15E TaxID=3110247 RepID=UPI002B21917D|nr:hypothetical protein [Crocosphaera sp. XPORK-15E]MEA5534581.1 hypothetical protein [Crocosphaera sp. XPORK-15E]